jgi:Fe2+ transport system protein FeoA
LNADVDTDRQALDCSHRSCRYLALARAVGRRMPRRCRYWCPVAASVVTLDQLRHGQAGRVLHVGGRPAARRRLLELGLVRGETIVFERSAPLGDPLEYVIKGYHLSLRRRDAATITVETLAQPGVLRDTGDAAARAA